MQRVKGFVNMTTGRACWLTMLTMKTLGVMSRSKPFPAVALGTARGNATTPLRAAVKASTELMAVRRRI